MSFFLKQIFAPEETKLHNITEPFLKFLELDTSPCRIGQEFSFMAMISGDTGEGKTTLENILITLLLKNPRRYVVFFKGQQSTVEEYRRQVPALKDRFYAIDYLMEIYKLPLPAPLVPGIEFVFVADEGGLDMTGKEALRLEMRSLVKFFKKSRHLKVIAIVLDQTKSVLKDYRTMCHFRFYKSLNDDYFEEQKDPWAKRFREQIINLLEEETVVRAKYKYFTNLPNEKMIELSQKMNVDDEEGEDDSEEHRKERRMLKRALIRRGYLRLSAKKYAPWSLKESISQNLQTEVIDHDYAKQAKTEVKINELAHLVADKYGDRLLKSKASNLVQAWLKQTYPIETYTLATRMKDIYNQALLILDEKGELYKPKAGSLQKVAQATLVSPAPIQPVENSISFAEYVKQVVGQVDPMWGEIAYEWAKGKSNRDTADDLKISRNSIGPFLQQFTQMGINGQDQLRSGYLFEDWFALVHGGDIRGAVPHNLQLPDFIDHQGNIYQLKCQSNTTSSQRYKIPQDCEPEYKEAVKQGKPFYFANLNIKWEEEPQIKQINPNQMEPAVIFYKPKEKPKLTVFRKSGAVIPQIISPDLPAGLQAALGSGGSLPDPEDDLDDGSDESSGSVTDPNDPTAIDDD